MDGQKDGFLPETEVKPFQNGKDPAEKHRLMAIAQKDKEAEAAEEAPPPHDRLYVVYFILMLHGIGTLMPWNMFITATDYFVGYKLNPEAARRGATSSAIIYNSNVTSGALNGTGLDLSTSDSAIYRNYFLSFLGFTAQVPNVLLNAINLFCQCGAGGNISKRIIWSIIVDVIMFIFTIVLAMINSFGWPGIFFWLTMVSVVIINMANGVYQNSVYGMAACLPMKYTNAVVLGSNISGTLTAILNLISIASTPNPRTAAIYYFLASIFVLLVAFDTYFALPLLPFYRFYHERSKKKQQVESYEETHQRPPFWEIFKKCWVQDLSVWFTFFVTLTCFPAIQAGVKRSSSSFIISEKYFQGVTCFLSFNLFAMLGNLFSVFVRIPGRRWVWLPVLLRGLFIPFFMFCNYQPEEGIRLLPVYITNDYVYVAGGILLAFTSGYFSSLTMMYAPGNVEPKHQATAGMMAAFFLVFGILCGVIFSLPVTLFIQKVGPSP